MKQRSIIKYISLFFAFTFTGVYSGNLMASNSDYPSKNIKIVVGFPPGGLTDQIARVLSNSLPKYIGQSVIVENKSGGNLVPATNYVAKSKPDGYTLHLSNAQPFTVNFAYYGDGKLPYKKSDYTAVAITSEIPLGLYVSSKSKFKSLADLVAYAKQKPGAITYGSPGTLGQGGLAMEAFKDAAKINILQVPYQGSAPALMALLSGEIDVMFSDIATAAQYIKKGDVRVLAVAQDSRLKMLPDAPTFSEQGYKNLEIPMAFNGVYGPPKTPYQIVDKLNKAINDAMSTPEALKFLEEQWLVPAVYSPEKMAELTVSDYKVFKPLMDRIGLKNKD